MIENTSDLRQLPVKRAILVVIGLVLIAAAVRIPTLGVPFERDEGEYAYIAWRLEHHELPYRDWVDQKPPAIFWIYRAALTLPLDPVRAVHLAALIVSAASASALFFLARRFVSQLWAFLAATIFILLSGDPWIEGTAANTEIFMLLPLVLSQVVFFRAIERSDQRTISMLVCGALIGIATAFKQVAAVNWLLLVGIFPVFAKQEKRWMDSTRFVICSATGALVVAALVAAYFWVRGGLGEMADNVFTHNLEYIGAMTWSERLRFCGETLVRLAPCEALVWIFVTIGLAGLIAARNLKRLAFLLGWLITSAAAISASGYFFPHYFQQWIPSIAILAVFGAEWISRFAIWKRSRIPGAILLVFLAILPLKSLWPFWFSYSSADAVRKIYPGNFFAEMPAFAERIAQVTKPDERVFIFGAEPELLFYARRVSASRYIFLFPLYGAYRNIHEKQVATTEEIQRNAPAAAVYVPNGLFFSAGSDQYFTQWSVSFLSDHFVPDTCLIQDTQTSASIVPARPDLPAPHNLLAAIFVKKPVAP